jgi:transcriptional regulator with XRE-family HTH domain
MPTQPVGEVAAQLRLERMQSQGQIEIYTGISQSRLSDFERGKGGLWLERFFALAEFYNEPIYWAGRRLVWAVENTEEFL